MKHLDWIFLTGVAIALFLLVSCSGTKTSIDDAVEIQYEEAEQEEVDSLEEDTMLYHSYMI